MCKHRACHTWDLVAEVDFPVGNGRVLVAGVVISAAARDLAHIIRDRIAFDQVPDLAGREALAGDLHIAVAGGYDVRALRAGRHFSILAPRVEESLPRVLGRGVGTAETSEASANMDGMVNWCMVVAR